MEDHSIKGDYFRYHFFISHRPGCDTEIYLIVREKDKTAQS